MLTSCLCFGGDRGTDCEIDLEGAFGSMKVESQDTVMEEETKVEIPKTEPDLDSMVERLQSWDSTLGEDGDSEIL